MIIGTHLILYTKDAEADRAFFRDVLKMSWVDSGDGWLIFRMPPAEIGIHPAEAEAHAIYLMCDDIEAEHAALTKRGATPGPVQELSWGRLMVVPLPGGGSIPVYQPKHKLAIDTKRR